MLWLEKAQAAFRNCNYLSIAADPSDYVGEETMVGAAYRADHDIGCTLPVNVPWPPTVQAYTRRSFLRLRGLTFLGSVSFWREDDGL